MAEVHTPEFIEYSQKVINNAKHLGKYLVEKYGETLFAGGTEVHHIIWDVSKHGISGNQMEKVYDKMRISTNKKGLIGDKVSTIAGGMRIGTPAVTTRGMGEKEMEVIGDFLLKGVEIAKRIQDGLGGPDCDFNEFVKAVENDNEVKETSLKVKAFAT